MRAWLDLALDIVWMSVRGLRELLQVILHPVDTLQLLGAAPASLGEARALIDRMQLGGVVIVTPEAQPLLRTALTGLGDLTMRVAQPERVSAGLLAEHVMRVSAALAPLRRATAALLRMHALGIAVSAALALAIGPSAPGADWRLQLLLRIAVSVLSALLWSLLLRLALRTMLRSLIARLRA